MPCMQVYYRLPLAPQLETILSRKGMRKRMSIRELKRCHEDDSLFTSRVWEKYVQCYEAQDTASSSVIAVSLGFDGVLVNGRDIWFVIAHVENLPREERLDSNNVMVLGILLCKPKVSSGMFQTLSETFAMGHPTRSGLNMTGGHVAFVVLLSIRADYQASVVLHNFGGPTKKMGGCVKCYVLSPRYTILGFHRIRIYPHVTLFQLLTSHTRAILICIYMIRLYVGSTTKLALT